MSKRDVVIGNVAVTALFVILAIKFEHWWIALFAILCFQEHKTTVREVEKDGR